jgi:hypothetical protein
MYLVRIGRLLVEKSSYSCCRNSKSEELDELHPEDFFAGKNFELFDSEIWVRQAAV